MRGGLLTTTLGGEMMNDGPEILTKGALLALANRKDSRQFLRQYIAQNKQHYVKGRMSDEEALMLIAKFYFVDQKNNYPFFYDALDHHHYWRLFIDLKKQRKPSEQGWKGYERREEGCLQAMLDAHCYIRDTMTEVLNADYIKAIHQRAARACKPLKCLGPGGWGGCVRDEPIDLGHFKTESSGDINMKKSWISPIGIPKMLVAFESFDFDCCPKVDIKYPFAGYECSVKATIDCYEKEVATTTSPMLLLKSIAKLVQTLEQQHPFKDGNCRTFAVLLLNRELVRHGFMPTILEDPNRFDGFTRKEMVFEILRGMQAFVQLREAGQLTGCPIVEAPPLEMPAPGLAQAVAGLALK